MYSEKENVLQLVALLKAHAITHIVFSPGSRNSPLIHSFATDPDFPVIPSWMNAAPDFLLWVLYKQLKNR
jgi:2-succinyl-5-enolpyruvyl-6-hydroxy-3-cyclohexene-1-carboxylate synthase